MPVKDYEAGTPTWVDLLSTDMDAATRFYTGLFGWGTRDDPMPDGAGVYRTFQKGGRDVAGLGQQGPEMAQQGMPSVWTLYIGGSVEDVARRTQAAGGQVVMGPVDVGETGRLAVLVDPGGAAIGVWEPGTHRGFTVAGEPGSLVWSEVNTRHFDDCLKFYPEVFGWTTEDGPPVPDSRYMIWKHGNDQVGGMLQMNQQWEGIPSHWMIYFGVDDTDAAARRVSELGGKVQVPPFDTSYGRIAVVIDPTGAAFSIVRPTGPAPG